MKITCKSEIECLHSSVSSFGDVAEMERKRMVQVKNASQVYVPLDLQFTPWFQKCLKTSIFIMVFQNRMENKIGDLISFHSWLVWFILKNILKNIHHMLIWSVCICTIVPESVILVRGHNYSLPVGHILPLDVVRNKDSEHYKA